jgi:hypothetical protein
MAEFMVPEFALRLSEIYTTHNGIIDFTKYPLEIAYDLSQADMVLRNETAHPSLPRFAIVIVAFKDAKHLAWLIKAVHIPHQYSFGAIGTSEIYQSYEKDDLTVGYHNILAVVQFGTVTYRTDSVSTINLNYLLRKRIIFTAGERKYQQRTKKTNQNGFVAIIPDFTQTNTTTKTNSGNQAVVSHKFVRQLTSEGTVCH